MVRANYTGDMELSMSSLFAEVRIERLVWPTMSCLPSSTLLLFLVHAQSIGQDSKTARVFKMINQSVIFIPIIILKTEITKSHVMTKVLHRPLRSECCCLLSVRVATIVTSLLVAPHFW